MKILIFISVCVLLIQVVSAATFRNSSIKLSIVGGDSIDISKVPYQVSFSYKGSYHFCGGSIIAKNWILSAAHCFKNPADISHTVRSGSSEIGAKFKGIEPKIAEIIKHPSFAIFNKFDSDVALVRLKTPLTLGKNIGIVALPAEKSIAPDGTNCLVSGWGKTSYGAMNGETMLRAVTIPLVNTAACFKALPTVFTERMICAGFPKGGKGLCQGDSGGPLVCNKKQEGIVSFGLGCSEFGYYVKVSSPSIRNWIKKISGV